MFDLPIMVAKKENCVRSASNNYTAPATKTSDAFVALNAIVPNITALCRS
jgi:hypothetical protein